MISEAEEGGKVSKGVDGKKDGSVDKDKRPIALRDGKKLRIDDPKEIIKADYQLQQALSYLKAWNIFQAAAPEIAQKGEKSVSAAEEK